MAEKNKAEVKLDKLKNVVIDSRIGISLEKRLFEISESIEILNLELDANIIDGSKADEYYRLGYELYRLKEEISKQLNDN